MKNKNIGSSFDDFLSEEGHLAQTEKNATKRVIAYQIEQLMKAQNISKAAMARKMHTSRSSVDRLLDPHVDSMTLHTLEAAAGVLGKKIHVELVG
ncbi:helix-turn-helix domain-containing protein [Sulfurimonas lithotrophica]|uniref:Helix-turn-helix domain-containing protein n=1 Tax=Sulfurimonas lithotrophica TaxID=2590022 RepID=A0A5P8P3P8_9BACT|nr:helix-turn-helix transcriptional regulator [Sulfurimonas lithotrophica]QFR50305.1 helix-turn-helix domain-containing protein [Sulfurimonas lithotrophica]